MKNDSQNERTLQTRLKKIDVEALETCKKYYGHYNDSELVRFLIRRTADNIQSDKPLAIISK